MTSDIAVFLNGFTGMPGGVNLKLITLLNLSQILSEIISNVEQPDVTDIPDIEIIDFIPETNAKEGSTTGTVNLNTFDGLEYNLQIAGEYTLIDSLNDSLNVQVRTQHPDGSPVTFNTAVATNLGGQRIGIYAQQDQTLLIDSSPVTLASGDSLSLTNGSISRNGNKYAIADDRGNELNVTIRDNRYRYLDIESVLADEQRNSVRGLLGNNNGDRNDDLKLLDETSLTPPIDFQRLYGEYVDGWRISATESLFDYQDGEDTNTFTELNFFANNNYLVGSEIADLISGGLGNDILTGKKGADILDGGEGIDQLIYRKSDAPVVVNLTTNTADGGYATGDIIANFEYLSGSFFGDTLTGNQGDNQIKGQAGNDVIFGKEGNDNIFGGRGADTLYGGEGIDQLIYGDSDAAVTINLTTNSADGGYATGDIIDNFEYATGSIFDDNITGNEATNHLRGQLGNDILSGEAGSDLIFGGGGADTLDGGEGIDQLIYGDSDSAVTINLATNSADGGHATGDTIENFEYVTGSQFNDTITGNEGVNHLRGQNGSDRLSGGGNNDILFGGRDGDILLGGDGIDTFTLNNLEDSLLASYDRIRDLKIGSDKINSTNSVSASSVNNLGRIDTLDETGIQELLTSDNFAVEQAATFTFDRRTFLVLNNGVAGYSATEDALIEITGFEGSLSNLAII